ncbi:MAG: tetratricopeptide repeat protein [Candidatus Cloacimonetes bacterium]|nr:tetratricopeptide repeat protein [Candidatus Cloacimonadota bacterium]
MKKIFIVLMSIIFLISNHNYADCSYEINKAKIEIKKKNYTSAKNILEKSIDSADNTNSLAEIYFLIAQCAETSDEVNKYYKKILNLKENNYIYKAKLALAKNYFCSSDYSKSKKYLNQILKNPISQIADSKEALYWSGQNCFALKDYNKCIDYLKEYLEMGNENTKIELALFNIGTSYFKLKNFSSALHHFQNLKNSNINKNFSSNLLYMMGLSHEKLSQFDKAIVSYKEVINQYPYSDERFLAESQLVNLAEKGIYTSSINMPEINTDFDKKYIVQLSAFLDKEKAEKSKAEFRQKGYDIFIYEKIVKGKNYFAVGLGPYKTKTEAQYIQNKLKKNSISSFIYKKP